MDANKGSTQKKFTLSIVKGLDFFGVSVGEGAAVQEGTSVVVKVVAAASVGTAEVATL
jgi:hypothetical protein